MSYLFVWNGYILLLFLSDFWLGILNLKNAKNLKRKTNEEIMPIAWHPKRWWNFCMSEDQKNKIEPIFTEKCI